MRTVCAAAVMKASTALFIILLLISPTVVLAGGVSNAELISIESLDDSPYQQRITVRVGFRMEQLLVSPNTSLNNLHIVNTDGIVIKQSSTAYAGIVESLPNSWARVVIDGDYIAGTIHAHGNSTHFTSEDTTNLSIAGVLAEPIKPPPDTTDRLILRETTRSAVVEEVSVPVNERLTQTVGDVTRVIRIGVVVDALYQEALGGRGLSNAISTINSVDGLYREEFGLALKVDVVVLVTDNDFLSLDPAINNQNPPSLKDHLDLFREYRINSNLLPDDLGLVHLFTGVQSEDQAIGLAFSGAACRTDGHDVSLARPFLLPVLLSAHEIGHNLGADHDDTTACRDIVNNLMFSSIGTTTTRDFSSCSTEMINTRLEQSTCFTGVLDIGLDVVQLESNQIEISVSNLDETRAFPSATLFVNLVNASVTEAPSSCELIDPNTLNCLVPATFAGDTQKLAVKLRLEPDLERSVLMSIEPNDFFDLNTANNAAALIIPGEELPLADPEGEVVSLPEDPPEDPNDAIVNDDDIEALESSADETISEDDEADGNVEDLGVVSGGNNEGDDDDGGGGSTDLPGLLILFASALFTRRSNRTQH